MTAINDYELVRPLYEQLTDRFQMLLETLLGDSKIRFHAIEARAKAVDSFAEKISRFGKQYSDPLT